MVALQVIALIYMMIVFCIGIYLEKRKNLAIRYNDKKFTRPKIMIDGEGGTPAEGPSMAEMIDDRNRP